jgi:para-aminobenzoate synthetase/4-amino-4-deoxychorismate lyase
MEIIADLGNRPRGVYCGAIGYLSPDGATTFSVAIRTLLLDHSSQTAVLGVGSGITSDSNPDEEYQECLAKGAFVTKPPPAAGLIESLRLEDNDYPLLDRHLQRIAWSANRLGIPCDLAEAKRLLENEGKISGIRKVRLHLDPHGTYSVTSEQVGKEGLPLALSVDTSDPVDSDDLLLYLKTDRRERYAAARARHLHVDEVLLVNSRGELTEGSYNSVVLEMDGEMLTPPLSSGLLPGIFREIQLECGKIKEKVLYPADLERAEMIWLINAVRGWRRGVLADTKDRS